MGTTAAETQNGRADADVVVPRDRVLSRSDIKARIRRRVKERESWGFRFPKNTELVKFLSEVIPKTIHKRNYPSVEAVDDVFPVHPVNYDALRRPPPDNVQATWIGHATVLVQMGGFSLLTDPIFSKRCSHVQWAGPERYRPPACTVQDLIREGVRIDAVLVSHNHYDHLDYASVRDIARAAGGYEDDGRGVSFVVPLGLRSWFRRWVPESLSRGDNTVVELDWHESTVIHRDGRGEKSITVTAVPMQHWSSRTGFDRDKSLWCGFSVCCDGKSCVTDSASSVAEIVKNKERGGDLKFLFAGDTGWFEELNDVGRRYGPFDLAAVPIGAYEPRDFMKPQHMNPEEAVWTMVALRARKAVPIHWGTFQLTFEPIMEPKNRLATALSSIGIQLDAFPAWNIGSTVTSQ